MTDFALRTFHRMGFVQLLDRTIGLSRRNFLSFMGIVAVPYIPIVVLQGIASAVSTYSVTHINSASPQQLFMNPAYWVGILGSIIVVFLDLLLIRGLGTAALTRAIADSYSGRPVGVLSSYTQLGGSAWRLIGALLVMIVILTLVLIWAIVPCIGWISGLGLYVFLALAVVPLIAPISVLENNGVLHSMRRAWDLSRSRFWWVIAYVCILTLLSALVVGGP